MGTGELLKKYLNQIICPLWTVPHAEMALNIRISFVAWGLSPARMQDQFDIHPFSTAPSLSAWRMPCYAVLAVIARINRCPLLVLLNY